MNECKCGKIPPCYTDGYGVWHYLDDTHDKVYELNRQMCDLEIDRNRWDKIGKEWDSKKEEIVLSIFKGIGNQIKERDMEKKTKKMTKAEAFEYLTGKKVHVFGKVISDDVLTRLFACGVEWCNGGTDICYYSDYLIISPLGRLSHCGGSTDLHYWERHGYEEISADDILSIEIVEENCLDKDCAMSHAMEIMRWLREKKSPHTTMIIDGNHAELLEGVKSVVWKEDMK